MENVWEKLKTLKGRSWTEAKDVLNKIKDTGSRIEDVVVSYKINSETLSEEDREIYGVHPKDEPFYLERCKLCSRLLKPTVLDQHYDLHHKRNTNNVKKSSFISPSKKKYSRKGNKSTSEDDSESVISSETPSPAVDLLENSLSNLDGSSREDGIVDISVEEIPSEDSKPPTPGPQDLYEEFAVPNTEEVSSAFSSSSENESSKPFSNSKSLLKLKITTNKDAPQKSQSTSLLEAHLLSNTKYNSGSGHSNADMKYRNSNFKFNVISFSKTDQSSQKEENEQTEWNNSSFNVDSPKLKNETKISIPISVLPQNVKIIGSLKKSGVSKSTSLLKNNPQKSVSNSDSKDKLYSAPSSPYSVSSIDNVVDLPASELISKNSEKVSAKSKKNKRSKGKNRSTKNVEYDPDKHCGVFIDDDRHCMRSLTCKTHLISLRRAVEGRSKEFDKLLADHRASKELLKEQERNQSFNLSEPIISLPLLSADKLTGNTIHITSTNNESEIIKIRVPNAITNPEITHNNSSNYHVPQSENNSQKTNNEKIIKKLSSTVKLSNAFGAKPNTVKVIMPVMKSEPKSQLFENDIKISFVCSDMLYKVGGLLYMDRSRQAVRKCMDPLINKDDNTTESKPNRSRRFANFLPPLKYNAPIKLSIFKKEDVEKKENVCAIKSDVKLKVNEELERMKTVLAASCKLLNTLSSDDNKLKKLKMSRKLKRKGAQCRNFDSKKMKQVSISDENYDINSLLSFDKGVKTNEHFVGAERFSFNTIPEASVNDNLKTFQNDQGQQNLANISNMMENIPYNMFLNSENVAPSYTETDTAQLLQTFKDLENQICNTVGNNISNLHYTQALPNNTNNTYIDYITTNTVPNNVEFKENCENEFKVIDSNIPNFEENIAKNYSFIEEYCKSIATGELFLDDKTDFEFYENGNLVNGVPKSGRSNEIIVVNENVFNNERTDNITRTGTDDGLNFDTHILNTYLSSISGEPSSQNPGDINFAARQFDINQVAEPQDSQNLTKETVYDGILALNKQFQDNTAVKIDQPSTPTAVYAEAENEEVLKWLF